MVYWILDLRIVLGDWVKYQQAAMCKYLGKIPKLYYITSLHYYIHTIYTFLQWTIENCEIFLNPYFTSAFAQSSGPRSLLWGKKGGWGIPHWRGWFKLRICISLEVNGLQIMIMNGIMTIMMIIKFMVVASIMMIATMRTYRWQQLKLGVFLKKFSLIFSKKGLNDKSGKNMSQLDRFFIFSTILHLHLKVRSCVTGRVVRAE